MRSNGTITDYKNVRIASIIVSTDRNGKPYAQGVAQQLDQAGLHQGNVFFKAWDTSLIEALVRIAKKVTNNTTVEFENEGQGENTITLTGQLSSNKVKTDEGEKWYNNFEASAFEPTAQEKATPRKRTTKAATK